ncbi:esterase-like activity of phytase family protein [Novispirillum itersonii]|uniref:esterase-like activity of phytase family protein n=1 Tax=Novispirillum itersonii TaxID=189 RepID=UPI0003696858|nr:esterase-like activity of phytase family protein [Novispirillum itersonii]
MPAFRCLSRSFLAALSLSVSVLALAPAVSATEVPAVLEGFASLPAATFVQPPKDAPPSLEVSGRYAQAPKRVDGVGLSAGRPYVKDAAQEPMLPFKGQPVQGFSGIKPAGNGDYVVLTDNGFGTKANSPDAMLMFHVVHPDWKTGKVSLKKTVFLHDPDRKVPFLIVNENTGSRYLTGADFDPESIQTIGEEVWIGDEFGPYLIRADKAGKVLAVFETKLDGRVLKSPDNYTVITPPKPGPVDFDVRRSKGFEGMAASPDGKTLYPLLEGALITKGESETREGREYLRILQFDVASQSWTGTSWKYLLDENGLAIGDFNMIDATTALVIERDNGEGDPRQACTGEARPDCQKTPAKIKRIYKIDLAAADADGFVKKVAYIDLMAVKDPKGVVKGISRDGVMNFPFFTIEDVHVVDATHIIVANDNNLPFSAGRAVGVPDNNEFMLLSVPDLLSAK